MDSVRIFECLHCRCQVFVCSRCDRGYKYCSHACREKERKEQCRRAHATYMKDEEARETHRLNQQEYRARKKSSARVIDQSSKNIEVVIILEERPENLDPAVEIMAPKPVVIENLATEMADECSEFLRCSFCGRKCSRFARRRFLTSPEYEKKPFFLAFIVRRFLD